VHRLVSRKSIQSTSPKVLIKDIAPADKYPRFVIPAQAGIQQSTGCRIKSGMTGGGYLVAGLIMFFMNIQILC
jgi:hypothetical protein